MIRKKSTEDIIIAEQKYCNKKQYVYVILVFSFLLKGAPACEGMRSLYLYNA